MRYKVPVPEKYCHGDQRIVKGFAFLPIECENGEAAWLEKVSILQEYRVDPTSDWHNLKFV